MSYSDGKAIYATQQARAYPHLDALLGGYFHQDFDLFGNTLAGVLQAYKDDAAESEREGTVAEIQRFLAHYGQTDASLAENFQRIFQPGVIVEGWEQPGVIVEGWEGMTTRQWLMKMASLLA